MTGGGRPPPTLIAGLAPMLLVYKHFTDGGQRGEGGGSQPPTHGLAPWDGVLSREGGLQRGSPGRQPPLPICWGSRGLGGVWPLSAPKRGLRAG